ncbi:hypothetical protein GGF37_000491 [Kickxella alabastrina]|nr:hypothetical protein GGF37_000491 [Kickxella alabastrina]
MSLYTIESFSSLISELSEDQQTVESTGNITLAMANDIYAQLDRVSNRRLDKQCAALPRRPTIRQPSSSSGGGMLELSDILHRASKMQAQRLSNQDYTRKPGQQLAAGRQSQSAKRTEREKKHHWVPDPRKLGKANCKPNSKRTDGDTATGMSQPAGSLLANIIETYGAKCR